MSRLERICPQCGAANRLDAARCTRCHTVLDARRPERAPAPPLSRSWAAALAVAAAGFLARAGLKFALKSMRAGVDRVRHAYDDGEDVKATTVDGEYALKGWRPGRTGDPAADKFEWPRKKV
jgi:hypothetical protein